MIQYYKVLDKELIAKIDENVPYLFLNGQWAVDKNNILMDRIMGFDEFEPKDSPYRMGSTDMLSRVENISEQEALKSIE